MCLIFKKGTSPQIAQEDVVVWKILRYKGGELTSYQQRDHKWEIGKTYKVQGAFAKSYRPTYADGETWENLKKVYQEITNRFEFSLVNMLDVFDYATYGFHSFSTRQRAVRFLRDIYQGGPLVEAIIPKGSRYIEGVNEQILSDTLKLPH